MTLNTTIWLHGPIHGRAAFRLSLNALLTAAGRGNEIETAKIQEQPAGSAPEWMEQNLITHERDWPATEEQVNNFRHDYDQIGTTLGQGLPGIVDIDYREDGSPLATEDHYDEEQYEDEEPYIDQRKCQVELSWDTAYGHQEGGLSCTMLHAKALILLYESLPADVTLTWENEYTGDIYEGLDGLVGFLGGGDEAQGWFMNTVKPAMEVAHPGIQWAD